MREVIAWSSRCQKLCGLQAVREDWGRRWWKVFRSVDGRWQVARERSVKMGEGYFESVDVCDSAAVTEFCKKAQEKMGSPDLLVNNAALMNPVAKLWEVPEEEFGKVIDVNIKGVANMIRAALPMMIERGSGVVVNFSSGWGRSVSPEVAPYCATKWAMEGLSLALAEELPEGLAAVALNPGVIDTDMLRQTWGESAGAISEC